MKFIRSNKYIVATWLVIIALIAVPLFHVCMIALALPLEHLTSMFSAPEAVKLKIKAFATYGVLLALSCFVAFALSVHYKQLLVSFGSKAYLALLAFITSGVIGSVVYVAPAYQYHYVAAPLSTDLKGSFKASIQFKTLPERFVELLHQCKQKTISCYIHTLFTENTSLTTAITYGNTTLHDNQDHPISLHMLDNILTLQPLLFTFSVEEDDNPLIARDIGTPIHTTRDDQLWHNSISYPIPADQSLLIYFKFTHLDGTPIAVFF